MVSSRGPCFYVSLHLLLVQSARGHDHFRRSVAIGTDGSLMQAEATPETTVAPGGSEYAEEHRAAANQEAVDEGRYPINWPNETEVGANKKDEKNPLADALKKQLAAVKTELNDTKNQLMQTQMQNLQITADLQAAEEALADEKEKHLTTKRNYKMKVANEKLQKENEFNAFVSLKHKMAEASELWFPHIMKEVQDAAAEFETVKKEAVIPETDDVVIFDDEDTGYSVNASEHTGEGGGNVTDMTTTVTTTNAVAETTTPTTT